jgi:predicted ATPase
MTLHLDRISLSGFKSITKMELDLGDLNVLIGANGAGKSNFIGVFSLLGQLVERRLEFFIAQAGGPDAILTNGRQHTERLTIDLAFKMNGYTAIFQPSSADELIFEAEVCRFHDSDRYPEPLKVPLKPDEVLGAGHKETLLHERSAGRPIVKRVLAAMQGWKVYHFHDTSRTAKVKQLGDIDDNAALRADAGNLAAFLLVLRERHEARYRQIVETVRLAAPFFDDFQLRPDPRNEQKIRLEWRARDTDAYFNAHALSDGTLRFICLVTLLLQPQVPAVVVVDEPELGLHPYAVTLLASLLRAASKRAQVIVSTQSVSLVNQFEPEDIVVVDRGPQGSEFRRLTTTEIAQWLEEYSLGELWEKNIFGGRPR